MASPSDLTRIPFASPPHLGQWRCVKAAATIGYAYRHARKHLSDSRGFLLPEDRFILKPLVITLQRLGAQIRPSEWDDLQTNVDRAPPTVASMLGFLTPLAGRGCGSVWDLPPPEATYVEWPIVLCLTELIPHRPTRADVQGAPSCAGSTSVGATPPTYVQGFLPSSATKGTQTKADLGSVLRWDVYTDSFTLEMQLEDDRRQQLKHK